jgi:hypothetical protein
MSYLQIFCFWTLSIILSPFKNCRLFFKTQCFGDWILFSQVKSTQLGPIDRASPYFPPLWFCSFVDISLIQCGTALNVSIGAEAFYLAVSHHGYS